MTDVKKNIKKLYEDALFFHFVKKGYTTKQAVFEVKRILDK